MVLETTVLPLNYAPICIDAAKILSFDHKMYYNTGGYGLARGFYFEIFGGNIKDIIITPTMKEYHNRWKKTFLP